MKKITKNICISRIMMFAFISIVLMMIAIPKVSASAIEEATELAKSVEAWLILITPIVLTIFGAAYTIYSVINRKDKKARSEFIQTSTATNVDVKSILTEMANQTLKIIEQNELIREETKMIEQLKLEMKEVKDHYNIMLEEKQKWLDFTKEVSLYAQEEIGKVEEVIVNIGGEEL